MDRQHHDTRKGAPDSEHQWAEESNGCNDADWQLLMDIDRMLDDGCPNVQPPPFAARAVGQRGSPQA